MKVAGRGMNMGESFDHENIKRTRFALVKSTQSRGKPNGFEKHNGRRYRRRPALYGFVAGLVFGNVLGAQYAFQLKDWQTLFSASIALIGIGIAYHGVRGT